MKTKLLQGNVLKCMFLLWFLGFTLTSYAQCPLIPNPTPAPICDASSFTFSNLNTYATDMGNGIVWYDAPTGGTAYNANQLVYEGTYYAGDSSGSCGARSPIVVDFVVDASGENLDRIYCSNENATIQTYIDDVLAASIPSGGSVEIYRDFSLTNQAAPADVIPVGAQNYFIIFVDNSNCKGQIEIGQVGVFSAPQDPTPQPLQVFCSNTNPLVGNLDPGTTSTNFNWYENIDGFGNPVPPALSSTAALINGNTYYVQVDDIFCESNVASVTVNIETPPNPGTSSNLEYCNDSLPASNFDLFDELGGIKDTNGTWSGPVATSNGFRGTVNISGLTTGGLYIFSYTVPATTACPQSSATVAIQVYEAFSSGVASALNPALFCVSALPTNFDLFTLLENEDPNGQWTIGTSSSDPVTTSTIDLSSYTTGTYNFTYTQNLAPNPCPEVSTTVQVTVLQNPNAGNAINQSFCENDLSANSPFNLFDALDNTQDNNSGTWTDASNTTVSNSIDITSFTVAGSPYTYTYTIDNGACIDTEQITITIDDAPESGTANAPVEFCEGLAPSNYDLFDLLADEDQTGTWLDDDATGVLTGNIADLSSLAPATYNFTFDVDAIGSCDDVNVTVSVIINPLPNTGVPAPVAFCEND
ncbi:hypothetical protein, partial [Seonamhaeicola algicola]|uniref:hypothetical protein n=1 Tax=Seonamhaeicola algicola TaxID=1719036 RepID=UPI00164A5F49